MTKEEFQTYITQICDAVRTKKNSTEKIPFLDLKNAIDGLEIGNKFNSQFYIYQNPYSRYDDYKSITFTFSTPYSSNDYGYIVLAPRSVQYMEEYAVDIDRIFGRFRIPTSYGMTASVIDQRLYNRNNQTDSSFDSLETTSTYIQFKKVWFSTYSKDIIMIVVFNKNN